MFRPILPALSICLLGGAVQAQALTGRLGTMREDQVIDGCGCTFSAKGAKGRLAKGYVFSSEIGTDKAQAYVVFDGARMSLRQTENALTDTSMRRGTRWRALFASKDDALRVGLETTVVRDCSGRGEGCEAFDEEGILTLSLGSGPPEKLPIEGVCGC